MAKKIRTYVNPSSLGSYFGVGFNTPEEQVNIDMGIVEPIFDEASKARMMLGNDLEDATLNYFEHLLGIKITERNDKMLWFYDNKIKGKVDGMTTYKGIRTVVENKISNSTQGVFTDNLGYKIQVHCYMLATGTTQALLCGLYKGKPIFKLIQRDEDLINDIKHMTDYLVDVFLGFETLDNYPYDIVDKYTNDTSVEPLEDLTDENMATLKRLASLKTRAKEIKTDIDEIESTIKDTWKYGSVDNEDFKFTFSENISKGRFDSVAFNMAYPEIDLDKFKKEDKVGKKILLKVRN